MPTLSLPGMIRLMRPVLAFVLVLALAAPAFAQDDAEKADRQEPTPAYERQLLRLSEIMGAVHYLRGLCGGEGENWRDDMAALLEAEAPSPERRARLVSRFNRGYHGFAASYSNCTDSALVILDRYMTEGAELAQDIANRYGT